MPSLKKVSTIIDKYGEIKKETVSYIDSRGDFVKIYQRNLSTKMKGLKGVDYEVFFEMLEHMDYGNVIHIQQVKIARAIESTVPTVSRAISRMVERGILEKGQKQKGSMIYFMNKEIAEKGNDVITSIKSAQRRTG